MLLINQLLYFLFISGYSLFSHGSSEFHLIDMSKSYEDAKSYCREMYSDLATIHNLPEMNYLINLVSGDALRAWIGLEIANQRMWHWSLPGHTVDYTNWIEGNPQENDQDTCGAMGESGEWIDSDCETKRSFVCHGDKDSHIIVAETKSWRNAQKHCRELSTDLVRILSAEENEAVRNISQNSWIGLFKDPWKWSDGNTSSFRYWAGSQPNYLEDQDCTVAVFTNSGKWNDLKCQSKRKFICQGAYKVPTTTTETSTLQSTEVTNLSTVSNMTSQSVIVTFHFTIDTNDTISTSTPSTTASTASPLTTVPVTTDSTSAFPNTTLFTTTQSVTTQSATTQSLTTQSLTLAPNSNSPGNLVLIKQNFTWIEAIAFCRSHFIDLVHISNEDVQMKVAETVKNATTPHVWIGLKYTCSSKVWFWTRSTSGCYQNWAPLHGSEGDYSCGVTGAVEATGRQQWVGLPQTEKLNFICKACTA